MVATTPLMSYEEIIVDYVNQLRCELNEARELLKEMNDSGYKTIKGVEEGYKDLIADLQAEIEKLRDICRKQEEDRKALDVEIYALRNHNITLTNEQNELRDKNGLLSKQNGLLSEHSVALTNELRNLYDSRVARNPIDGDAAIKEGKANRSRFILSAAPELSSKDE